MIKKNNFKVIDSNYMADKTEGVYRYLERARDIGSAVKYIVASAAYISNEYKVNDDETIISIMVDIFACSESNIQTIVANNIDSILDISHTYSKEAILCYLYESYPKTFDKIGYMHNSSKSCIDLAISVLNINEKDIVADFGSGVGDFIISVANMKKPSILKGYEIDKDYLEMSKIRAKLSDVKAEFELMNIFDIPKEKKFDKIFSEYPLEIINGDVDYLSSEYESFKSKVPSARRSMSSNWLFNNLIIEHLTENGKAVVLMNIGSIEMLRDKEIREYFVKNGFIEAVIALPERLHTFTNISYAMVVLSRGNKQVKMIDATNIYESGRRQNTLSKENINEIISLLEEYGDNSISVVFDELEGNNYNLNPLYYLREKIEFDNGVEFNKIIKNITRGAHIRADELDSTFSDEPTNIQYLKISDIEDGILSDDMQYLKEIEDRYERYCVKDRNIIISKNGTPIKHTIAEVVENKKILVSGNFYIIEIDENVANPYYIDAFLSSKIGSEVLQSTSTNGSINNISVDELKKMIIPLPSIAEQNQIAEAYKAKLKQLKGLKKNLKIVKDELGMIFKI